MQIRPEETELVGHWELIAGHIHGDAVSTRIQELTQTYLTTISISDSGWETLYQDPADLRYWELTYPQSEMHGGGPPTLKTLSIQDAKCKYGI